MLKSTYFLLFLLSVQLGFSQGVGINDSGSNPDPSAILDLNSKSQGFLPPRMTTTERNLIDSPAEGLTIFNTSKQCLEYYSQNNWQSLCGGSNHYVAKVFTQLGPQIWIVPPGVESIDVLIVAGGGGGNGKQPGNIMSRPGGGAGGVLELLNYSVNPGDTINLVVGQGGSGGIGTGNIQATSGENSSFDGNIAFGGGRGGGSSAIAIPEMNGGSGGGSTWISTPGDGIPGSGVSGQGNAGGKLTGNTQGHRAGGGGGYSSAGQDGVIQNGGHGGEGYNLATSIWNVALAFGAPGAVAGGGGGGAYGNSGIQIGADGGLGGGGAGGSRIATGPTDGQDGLPNTGGGGGGAGGDSAASGNPANGGNGGSGVVILRWLTP